MQISYGNSCVAMANTDESFVIRTGSTLFGAEKAGLDACNESSCRIYYSACSLPKQSQ